MGDFFLADDLSGALDAGAAFHHAGRPVRIVWSSEAWHAAGPEEVVAFTTETRNASPLAAAAAVRRAIELGARGGGRMLYKKIDSTLRGQVGAELAAVQAALPAERILFAPANPSVGRTVHDGILLVNGVPVAQTEFGRDPASPVRESSIRALLGDAATPRVVIADTETAADLQTAVERMQRAGEPWIAVGSGALARPVAALNRRRDAGNLCASAVLTGPVLLVSGSAHPGNRGQAEVLAREHSVPVLEVDVQQPAEAGSAAIQALRRGGAATLLTQAARTESFTALQAITSAATIAITGAGVSRVFITGGETAFSICGALGVRSLSFQAELEPGLSISEGAIGGRRCWFAVKPGGFGDPHTWIRAWRALHGK